MNDDVFTDKMEPVYVLIDELDTNWVSSNIKYELIRALIETIRTFRKVENIKIIIALRKDLYDRIITKTRDEGFQAEKYKTFLLQVKWQKDELRNLVNTQIDYVFKSRYTKQKATLADIAPLKVGQSETFDYFYNRTFRRPRHIIMFVNECIKHSTNKAKFTASTIREAENSYSEDRLNAIKDEWAESYGLIDNGIKLIEQINKNTFRLNSITQQQVENLALDMSSIEIHSPSDENLRRYAEEAFENSEKHEKFLSNIFKVLYLVGLVGIKVDSNKKHKWYFEQEDNLSARNINQYSSIKIHPMFCSALGINPGRIDGFMK